MKTLTEAGLAVVEQRASVADDEDVMLLAAEVRTLRASLSSVPEDVARDEKAVRAALVLLSSDIAVPHRDVGLTALSRLATAAARVPGLEAELAKAVDIANAAGQMQIKDEATIRRLTDERDALAESRRAIADESEDNKAKLWAAESERDAARQERDEALRRHGKLVLDGSKAISEAEARATTAEKDAAYWRGQYNAMKDHAEAPRPTPAPGLREAVGPLVANLRGYQPDTTSSLYYARDGEPGPEVMSSAGVAALLAAYDAPVAAPSERLLTGIQAARNLLLYPTMPESETRAEVLRVLGALVDGAETCTVAQPESRFAVVDADEDTANGKTTGFDDRGAAPERRGCLPGDHVWWDNGPSCACRATVRQMEQDAAPEVVHEGKDRWFRILSGGRIQHRLDVSHPWVDLSADSCWENTETWLTVTEELARALAEARREWMAWRDRCEKAETNQQQRERKAAEDMREQCATLLDDSALAAAEPRLAERLAKKMRALPLEGK